MKTILMSLYANSNICISSGSVSIDEFFFSVCTIRSYLFWMDTRHWAFYIVVFCIFFVSIFFYFVLDTIKLLRDCLVFLDLALKNFFRPQYCSAIYLPLLGQNLFFYSTQYSLNNHFQYGYWKQVLVLPCVSANHHYL